ncbi:MAG: hypothetical protein WKG06_19330 [Segetibacter sp.]
MTAVGLGSDKTPDAIRAFGVARENGSGIARTLILRPEIMLYDEPTAGLRPDNLYRNK